MPKFDIMLYLVSNLTSNLEFAKFGIENSIGLKTKFSTQIPNFDINTSIYHYIGDVIL